MSARLLTVKQMTKVVKVRDKEPTDPPDLGPDQMRLYSYYKPGLVAGNYSITATQTITTSVDDGHQTLVINNTGVGSNPPASSQQFEVVVPRFSLDPAIINSYYPPDGHQDEGRILPHLVLNDPHYPWEISPGTSSNLSTPIDLDPRNLRDTAGNNVFRNLVPWVALLVFDPEELRFDDVTEMTKLHLPGFTTAADLQKQNPNGTFKMQVKDYLSILPSSSRIQYEKGDVYTELQALTDSTDIIFPTKDLFKAIFDGTNVFNRPPIVQGGATLSPGSHTEVTHVEAQKYMSHVRHINTIGFPDAGWEEEGLFSIVVSNRTGKLDIMQPHTQICHLVSIEHVDQSLGDWITKDSVCNRIGLVSLFSWIYTALPPNPINFVATVRNLVLNQQMLNLDKNILKKMDTSKNGAAVVSSRLSQGYTISRWRTQTGEETAAFNRGPLVPGPVPWPPVADMSDCSKTSQDYQILDPSTGMMDLSYSSAWQLGKVMAIADSAFSAALMRFRSIVYNTSIQETQMTLSSMDTKPIAASKIAEITRNIASMSGGVTGDPNRFRTPQSRIAAPAVQDPAVQILAQSNLQEAVKDNTSAGANLYNEFNTDKCNNTDWATILSWMCEKLNLGGIPPQYLLPEPAYLPPESLRFFHIDDFWLDCFIDGALSIASHLDSDDDVTRRRIKERFNTYLSTPVPRAGYKPQIPSYGFLIRSNLIKVMPDLRITVAWKPVAGVTGNDDRAPVCRWTKWDDQTLMALLDRQPEEVAEIRLAQPPHQLRFSLGSYVSKGSGANPSTPDLVEFDLRRLYTTDNHPEEWPEMAMPVGKTADDGTTWTKDRPTTWLNFDTRVVNIARMAQDLNFALRSQNDTRLTALSQGKDAQINQLYSDVTPNPCELGLELNDPSYYFKITPPPPITGNPTATQQRNRQLYLNYSDSQKLKDAAQKAIDEYKSRQPPPSGGQAGLMVPAVPPPLQSGSGNQVPSTPASIPKPPNVQTKFQPVPASRLSSNFKANPKLALTMQSKFKLLTFADYKGAPKWEKTSNDKTTATRYLGDKYDFNDYVPSLNIWLFDLVFSLQKTTKSSDQELIRIDIDIPLRTNPPDKKVEALLDANYDGPGVRMLSNQRFIPFMYYSESVAVGNQADNMHIELIPRSADDNYTIKLNDDKTSDLSFRLAEAPISKLEVLKMTNLADSNGNAIFDNNGKPDTNLKNGKPYWRGQVTVKMTEWYKTKAYPLGEPVVSTYVLLKNAVTDDKDW